MNEFNKALKDCSPLNKEVMAIHDDNVELTNYIHVEKVKHEEIQLLDLFKKKISLNLVFCKCI